MRSVSLIILILSIPALLFFLSGESFAAPAPQQDFCIDPATDTNNPNDFLDSGKGFVPCGIATVKTWEYTTFKTRHIERNMSFAHSRDTAEEAEQQLRPILEGQCRAIAQHLNAEFIRLAAFGCGTIACSARCEMRGRHNQEIRYEIAPSAEVAKQLADARNTDPDVTVPPASEFKELRTGVPYCPCQIGHFFLMGYKIYKFALEIVILIAGLMLVIGGILMMISGGMPAVYQIAKKMIIYSLVGIVIVLASWVIVNTVFLALGYNYVWNLPGIP